jgi:hypothetical protein
MAYLQERKLVFVPGSTAFIKLFACHVCQGSFKKRDKLGYNVYLLSFS